MNILIIDDHQIVKEGIQARIIKVLPNANCHFTSSVRMAEYKIREIPIDLIFCDLEFSDESNFDGFYVASNISSREPKIKLIALTNYNAYRIMNKAKASGFHSFLSKSCTYQEFSDTLLNVLDKGYYESATMKCLTKKRRGFLKTIFADSFYGLSFLSDRELELALLSAKTTCRQELSKIMKVKPYTVDTYFKKALAKLNLKHRKELSLFALEFKDEILKYNEQ